MKYFTFVLFVVILLLDLGFAQLTSTFTKTLSSGTCGIPTGGPVVQQLTTTLTDTSGLFWSDAGEKIAYVERFGPAFGRYTLNDGTFNRVTINEGKEPICIFPVANATGLKFVIGLDHKLVLASIAGSDQNITSTITELITISNKSETFTKGKIDNKGRLWYTSAGSNYEESFEGDGSLYKIDNLGEPEVMESKLQMGAGMAWTKDYKFYYLVDSLAGVIYKYDFDGIKGLIGNQSTVFNVTDYKQLDGHPYDLVIDDAGFLWIGILGDGIVIQYDENSKKILWTIPIPASDIVSLEFGGLEKKILFVGTTNKLLLHANKEAGAGAIFGISGLGAIGIPDNEIVIPEQYH